jgi:RNA polymerase sigma-70 factor (ECF subfamily)
MEDSRIIDLYWQRDEDAIPQTQQKYGAFCTAVAMNVLGDRQDAEECVNDTWLTAWNRIPPTRPERLKAFLGRITRDLSIDRWRSNRAKKRYDGTELLLSELEDCVPAAQNVEAAAELRELTEAIDRWLKDLETEERVAFVRRYWYGEPVKDLAKHFAVSPNQMAQRLRRLRLRLRQALEAKGVTL